MKSFTISLIPFFFCVPLLLAQETAPKPAVAANPGFEFAGKTYFLGDVSRSKGTAKNTYYTQGDSPKSWLQRVSISLHPGQTDIRKAMEAMIGFYKKGNQETELGKLSTPRIVSFYAYEKYPKHHQFNIHCLHHGANGKGVVVRTYSIKNLPKNEQAFRAGTTKAREAYLSKLAVAKFPKFSLKKPNAAALDGQLPVLNPIKEKVTNIQGEFKLFTIDDDYAKKNGAKPGGHRPFTVIVPDRGVGKITTIARPKVKDVARYTLISPDGKKILESIRFTGLNAATDVPMEKRLQRIAALLEKQMVPQFFAGHKDGKIGMRYRTIVGPYDAACLLGRLTTADGTVFYIKFVAILADNEPQGIAAIMLLNPTGDKPENIKKRLQDGFAQQVLHSIRFKK